ncbi:MAG: hypothetical protein HYV95_09355 [Opitutae bacterium]|nr:hypothetical protein [Opitutae bacterium]
MTSQSLTELLGWKVSDVSLVVFGFAVAWAACFLGATIKYIFRSADGKQPIFEE